MRDRPTASSPETFSLFLDKVEPGLSDRLGVHTDETFPDIRAQIEAGLLEGHESGFYTLLRIAERIRDAGISFEGMTDDALLYWLNALKIDLPIALSRATAAWVIETGARITVAEGQHLAVFSSRYAGGRVNGFVKAVDKTEARCLIEVSLLGGEKTKHWVPAEAIEAVLDGSVRDPYVAVRASTGFRLPELAQ